MLWVLKGTVLMRQTVSSFEHPKQMLKFMGKKKLQFYAEKFCLSKPVPFASSRLNLNPSHADYFYVLRSQQSFPILSYSPAAFQLYNACFFTRQKPADLDLQCFLKRINLGLAEQGLNLSRTVYI